jgi:hypothetical protein
MTNTEKLKIALAALEAIASMPMEQFSYQKAFTRAVERAEEAIAAMGVRLLEVLNKKELTLDEFINLTEDERKGLSTFPYYIHPRNFINLGNMVYLRQGDSIVYLEGAKYEVRDTETHALMEIGLDQKSYVYGIPLRDPITRDSIKAFIHENDIAFWLKSIGAQIRGFRIETHVAYSFDPSNSTLSDLPHYLGEITKSEAFDSELIPCEPTVLDIPNTIRLSFTREDTYSDRRTKHQWVDSSFGTSIATTGYASLRNSSKYDLIESHMLLFLERYYDTFKLLAIEGRNFRSRGRCSKRTSSLIARYQI